jgi:BolA family transcriptional regulator, general stress-responsive regulator
MNEERIERMRQCLQTEFHPARLEIADESHLHIGHPGASTGLGHFAVIIEAEAFRGRNPLERHRMIYQALGDMMRTDIHALRLTARPPAGDPPSDE